MKLKKDIITYLVCLIIGISLIVTGLIFVLKSTNIYKDDIMLTIGCLSTTFGLSDIIISTCIHKLNNL